MFILPYDLQWVLRDNFQIVSFVGSTEILLVILIMCLLLWV